MNVLYDVGPITARIPLTEFSKFTYVTSNDLLTSLSEYLSDRLPYVPSYVSRKLKADKVTISSCCNVASINYNLSFAINEEKLIEELREIVEENGLKLNEVKSSYYVDTLCYTLILGGEGSLHFTNDSITKESAIKKEIIARFKPLHLMFKFNLDYECF